MAAEPSSKRPKKKRRKISTKQKSAELAIADRQEKAAQLKLAGWTDREIAAHLGVSLGTANTDINAVLKRLHDSAEDAIARQRRISLGRLEKSVKGIWPGVEAGDLATVDTLVKVEQRRARLLGLDAAEKRELAATVQATGPGTPAEAARLVREAFGEKATQKNGNAESGSAGAVQGDATEE